MIQGIPVIVTLSGGIPVTQVNYDGAPTPGPGGSVATVTDNGYGVAITLVDSGGTPMSLFNLDGSPYTGGGVVMRILDVAGPELVVNGQFSSDISGWTDAGSAVSALSWQAPGYLRTTNTSGTSRARQPVTEEAGKRYAFAVQNVGTPTVAGSISLGTTAGGTQYPVTGGTTNILAAQRLGIAEFLASSATAHIQMAAPVAGSLDWDHATMRELIASPFARGTVFTDDFSGGDGPIVGRVNAQNLPWRLIGTTNFTQVVPSISSGAMVMAKNASGASAGYPYWDFGNGIAHALKADLAWQGSGAAACMISVAKTGARLTIADIVANSIHIVFTDTKVDITTYVSGVASAPDTVNYAAPCATDGTVYPNVGWSLSGNTLTLTLPDGSTVQRTNAAFSAVAGGCAVFEQFYPSPASGAVAIGNAAATMG